MKKLIVLLLVICLSATVANAAMRKGPYLIYPGENTKMMVLWQLDGEETCRLRWGLDTSYSTGSTSTTEFSAGVEGHQHKHTITGLTPGTKYCYEVNEPPANLSTGTFYTAPPETAKSVKFFAYGDGKTGGDEHNKVNYRVIQTYEADPAYQTFIMYTGDWVSMGEIEADWDNQHFNRSMPNNLELQANLPINGCMGNHEWDDFAGTLFDKYYPYPYPYGANDANLFYSFDYGPAHIVAFDQYAVIDPNIQENWLKNDLATTDKEWKFIQLHEPGYAPGGGHPDDWDVREEIQPLAEVYGVDIVFCGHNHYYGRCEKNGVTWITTGAAGTGLASYWNYPGEPNYSPYVISAVKAYSFCKIAIDGKQLELTAVDKDGNVLETFKLDHRCLEPALPFSNGFEDANTYESDDITGGWDFSDYRYIALQGDANSGSYAAQIVRTEWLQRAISTEGFSDIHVKYARKTASLPGGKYLHVEWSTDAENWTNLESTADTSWASKDWTCDANANNSPGFRVRFRSDGVQDQYAYIDDVEITGTAMYVAGDFDGTGSVGFRDLDIFTDQWLASCTGQPCCDECDIGGSAPDGFVDFVDFAYLAGNWSPDTTAPTPDPMTWDTVPYATTETSIAMVATTATDGSDVEYFFDETSGNPGASDSSWQDSASYEDTGLTAATTYTYKVKARDLSPNLNETAFSDPCSAITTVADTTPPEPSTMTWQTVPYATSESSIAMVATTATDPSGVQYYFEETSGNPGGSNSSWQAGTSYTDTGLTPSTQYSYKVKARDLSPANNETAFSTPDASATTEAPDTTPPNPDPMTWDTVPYGTGSDKIRMIATTATDPAGVKYFFDETSANPGGSDSGWQESPEYEDSGLSTGTQYTYKVKARDKSLAQNETAFSDANSAMTPLFRDNFGTGDIETDWYNFGGDSVNSNFQCKDCGEPENEEGANLKKASWMETKPTKVNTAGFQNIVVKYGRMTHNYDIPDNEYLTVSWYDGTSWTQLEQVLSNDTCGYPSWSLPVGANNKAGFKVKWSTNATANNEYGCVDNIEIWGTPQ